MIRPVNDPSIRTTGLRRVKLQSLMLPQNNGTGADLHFYDRLRISKGAEGDCNPTVTLDLEANPLVFLLSASFAGCHLRPRCDSQHDVRRQQKMALAKRALIQTINLLWQQNKETRVTIVCPLPVTLTFRV